MKLVVLSLSATARKTQVSRGMLAKDEMMSRCESGLPV